MYHTLYVTSKNIYENVFLLTSLFWFISASDGVDVWHLRLDQEQLDSHVRFLYSCITINNDEIAHHTYL